MPTFKVKVESERTKVEHTEYEVKVVARDEAEARSLVENEWSPEKADKEDTRFSTENLGGWEENGSSWDDKDEITDVDFYSNEPTPEQLIAYYPVKGRPEDHSLKQLKLTAPQPQQ